MNHLEPYREKAKSELAEIGAEIRKLKAKAGEAKADQQLKFDRYLSELEVRRQELGRRLESLEDAGQEAMRDLKRGPKEARDRLVIAKRAAKARFH